MKLLKSKFFLPVVLLIHLILLFITTFTLWPEMVVYPYLVNNGFQLYKDIINPYPPYFVLSLAGFTNFFGTDPFNFRVLTYLVISIIDVLIYKLSLNIYKKPASAALNLIFFVVLSLPFGANGLWFDLVQTPFILLAFYFFQRSKVLYSALLLTAAILIKQQAIWVLPFFTVVLFLLNMSKPQRGIKSFFILVAPIISGFLITLLFVSALSVSQDFIKWAIILPLFKAGSLPGYVLLPSLRQIIYVASLFALFIPVLLKGDVKVKFYLFGAVTLILFAYPRFDYFHLVPALSVLSLLFCNLFIKNRQTSKFAFVFLIPLMIFQFRFFQGNLNFKTRFFESDTLVAAENLKKQTASTDLLYMQNAPDQLLALSGRLPVKPWADEFPWYLEYDNTKNNILGSLEKTPPKYIVFQPYTEGASFSLGTYRPKEIVEYLNQSYNNFSKLNNNLWLKELKN